MNMPCTTSQYSVQIRSDCTSGQVQQVPVQLVQQISLPVKIIYSIFLVAIFALSVFGNSIVCLIVFKKPSMRSAINLLLANLALSHIMLALVCVPFTLTTLIADGWILGQVMCEVTAAFHLLFVCESALILAAISVDRYLIIVMRKDRLTSRRSTILIVALWITSLAVSIPPVIGWSSYVFYNPMIQCVLKESDSPADSAYIALAYCVLFFIPTLTMAVCYIGIYHKVRMNLRRIANCPAGVDTATSVKLGLHLPTCTIAPPRVDMSFKTRAYKTILILFLIFVLCWTPYSICFMIWTVGQSVSHHYVWGSAVIIVGYLNTAINPVIYFWRIRKFKEACAELLPKLSQWIPGLKVRTRRRINPSRAYQVTELATISQQSME